VIYLLCCVVRFGHFCIALRQYAIKKMTSVKRSFMENIGINSKKEATRIESFSDGVFAIAITLLIIEVKIPNESELQHGLLNALIAKWPTYLAFFIGFFTILVSWINHHYLFNHIYEGNHVLILANSYTLFLITFVPYPTAILAQSFHNGDLQTGCTALWYCLFSDVIQFPDPILICQ
jgi:uncharacterized membrane protein